ncbi:MAG: hypothetical protein KAH20_08085 [Methylococcales bacterium]|nr:hypothetical protein [Methylococcales bacterium]
MQTLQSILDDYPDVSDINSDKKSELNSKLSNAGLLEPGALLNISA